MKPHSRPIASLSLRRARKRRLRFNALSALLLALLIGSVFACLPTLIAQCNHCPMGLGDVKPVIYTEKCPFDESVTVETPTHLTYDGDTSCGSPCIQYYVTLGTCTNATNSFFTGQGSEPVWSLTPNGDGLDMSTNGMLCRTNDACDVKPGNRVLTVTDFAGHSITTT